MRDENQEALSALALSVRRAEGYNLLVAISPDAEPPSEVLAGIAELLPEGQNYSLLFLEGDEVDPLQELDQLLADRNERGPLVLAGFDRIFAAERLRSFLTALNLQRSLWIQRLDRTVIFWMPEFLAGQMLRGAPDFFDTRSDTLIFAHTGGVNNAARQVSLIPFLYASLLPDEVRRVRIEELKVRLKEVNRSREVQLCWMIELCGHLTAVGRWQDALEQLEKVALPLARRVGNPDLMFFVISGLAEARKAGGLSSSHYEWLESFDHARSLSGGKIPKTVGGMIGGYLTMGGAIGGVVEALGDFWQGGVLDSMLSPPDKAVAWATYAEMLEEGGKSIPALDAWRKAEDLLASINSPTRLLITSRIVGLLLDDGQVERAEKLRLEVLRPALAADPESQTVLREVGRQWSALGRKDKALQIDWMLAATPAAGP